MKIYADTWIVYIDDEFDICNEIDKQKYGKWLVPFTNKNLIDRICQETVDLFGIVKEAKYTNNNKGMACFYLECDDIETHKSIISYLLDNNCLPKTRSGRFKNLAFKLNAQTYAGEYGENFKSQIHLKQFIDLNNGNFGDDKD